MVFTEQYFQNRIFRSPYLFNFNYRKRPKILKDLEMCLLNGFDVWSEVAICDSITFWGIFQTNSQHVVDERAQPVFNWFP